MGVKFQLGYVKNQYYVDYSLVLNYSLWLCVASARRVIVNAFGCET